MPHKFNATRRNKVPRQGHRVTNWAEYNEGLRRRGDLTVWVSEEARTFENQKTEARIGVRVLNRMTDPARPAIERFA